MILDLLPRPAGQSGRLPTPATFCLRPAALNALVATYLLAACNATFWGHLARIFADRPLPGLAFAVVIWALTLLLINLLAIRKIQKPLLAALVIVSAVTSYYVDVLGIVVDREMIQNAAETTLAETSHMITWGFLLHVLGLGLLPAVAILCVPVRRPRLGRALGGWALVTVATLALAAGLLFANFKDHSSVLRERKELLASVQPLAPVAGAVRYAKMMLKSTRVVVAPLGTDARPGPYLAAVKKPVLLVIAVGETARAANWSLGGYGRETNPELARRDILYFSQVSSCGTSTAVSVPCMFSNLGQDGYGYTAGLSQENLLDVLVHAGFAVEWLDNNSSDKGVAARVAMRRMTAADGAEFCEAECLDGIFLRQIAEKARTITQNTVIVTHQMGSHGPSYWQRYPEAAAVFQPECETDALAECSTAEIVNAYDNTIRYTDSVLAETIDLLEASDRVIPALYYVSDHGESLGEGGLYLHGAPDFMAPVEQTHVPMVLWMSERFRASLGLDRDCLTAGKDDPVSHDNLFSTVLGLVDVTTAVRDPGLDLAGPCRTGATG